MNKIYNDKSEILKNAPARMVRIENIIPEFLYDIEIICAIMKAWGDQYGQIPHKMKANKEVAICAINSFGQSLEAAPYGLRNDPDVVKVSILRQGNNIKYASKGLRANKEICLLAIKENAHAYRFISNKLKLDDDIIKATLYGQGMALEYMPLSIRKQEKYFTVALDRNPAAFRYGFGEYIFKEEYIPRALVSGDNLFYMPDHIKLDKKWAKLALNTSARILEVVSDELKDDKQLVMTAIQKDPTVFKWVSARLKEDRDVFLLACVDENNFMLFSEENRNDIPLLIEALNRGMPVDTLHKCNSELLLNLDLLIAAAENNDVRAIHLLPQEIIDELGSTNMAEYLKFLKYKRKKEALELQLPEKKKETKKTEKI